MNKTTKKTIGVFGRGKTGSLVIESLNNPSPNCPYSFDVKIFHREHLPTEETLRGLDALIAFVPANVFMEFAPLFLSLKLPVVCGATGFSPDEKLAFMALDQDLKEKALATWIYSSNFSVGMNFVLGMFSHFQRLPKYFPQFSFALHEIHHTKKLDAPSGTALLWEETLKSAMNDFYDFHNSPVPITHERLGDVVGTHTLTIKGALEDIHLTHQAHGRKIFAEGAVLALIFLFDSSTNKGLIPFQYFFQRTDL